MWAFLKAPYYELMVFTLPTEDNFFGSHGIQNIVSW